MEQSYYNRCRSTHEDWRCPAGHVRCFVGETDEQIRHRREVARLEQRIENYVSFYEREHDDARRCPWPTCRDYVYSSRSSMYEHMRRRHGMPAVALVREAV